MAKADGQARSKRRSVVRIRAALRSILALDLATRCGWAHSCGASGVWDLRPKTDESAGMRLIRLRAKLEEVRKSVGVGLVVFEAFKFIRNHASGSVVQPEMQGVLKLWCEENEIMYRSYTPGQIKKFATGKGNANKQAMLEAAREKWGDMVVDDNHADALWLLELAKSDLVGGE